MTETSLSDFELDALKETANIGTGHAAVALSALLGQKVTIALPETNVLPVNDVGEHIPSANQPIVGIFSTVTQGLEGNVLMLLPIDSALVLLTQLDNKSDRKKGKLSKKDMELLKKLGSIVCSAYLTGLAQFFEQKIEFRRPNVVSSFGKSIVDFILVEISEEESVLLINVGFNSENEEVAGTFSLLFTTTSLSPLLQKLKEKMGVSR